MQLIILLLVENAAQLFKREHKDSVAMKDDQPEINEK